MLIAMAAKLNEALLHNVMMQDSDGIRGIRLSVGTKFIKTFLEIAKTPKFSWLLA